MNIFWDFVHHHEKKNHDHPFSWFIDITSNGDERWKQVKILDIKMTSSLEMRLYDYKSSFMILLKSLWFCWLDHECCQKMKERERERERSLYKSHYHPDSWWWWSSSWFGHSDTLLSCLPVCWVDLRNHFPPLSSMNHVQVNGMLVIWIFFMFMIFHPFVVTIQCLTVNFKWKNAHRFRMTSWLSLSSLSSSKESE